MEQQVLHTVNFASNSITCAVARKAICLCICLLLFISASFVVKCGWTVWTISTISWCNGSWCKQSHESDVFSVSRWQNISNY